MRPPPPRGDGRRSFRRLTLGLAAISLSAAIGCASPGTAGLGRSEEAWELLTRSCPAPPVEGQLLDFERGRSIGGCTSLDARLAIATLLQYDGAAGDAETLRRAGVAALIGGSVDRAIAILGRTTAMDADCASCWNDLGVAHLTRARQLPADWARAADALDRAALLRSDDPRVTANRLRAAGELGLVATPWRTREQLVATVRDRLSSSTGAMAAPSDVLAEVVERHLLLRWADAESSGDAASASGAMRAARVAAAQAVSARGDESVVSLVAELDRAEDLSAAAAWRAYLRGIAALESEDIAVAATSVQLASALRAVGPVAGTRWLLLRTAVDRIQGRSSGAATTLRVLEGLPVLGFPYVRGRWAWQLGLISDEAGDTGRALQFYRDALSAFGEVGEREGAAVVHGLLATVYKDLNDFERAWEQQRAALRLVPFARRQRRESVRTNAAGLASAMQLSRLAANIRADAVAEARADNATTALAFLLADQALDLSSTGDVARALDRLTEGRGLLSAVTDAATRDLVEAVQLAARAHVLATTDAAAARQAALDAIRIFRARDVTYALPELLLIAGRASVAQGQLGEAERALTQGVGLAGTQESLSEAAGGERRAVRWDLYRELIELRLQADRPWEALALIDRARSSGLETGPAASHVAGKGSVQLTMVVLPQRTAVWVQASDASTHYLVGVSQHSLEQAIGALTAKVSSGAGHDVEAARLFELLFSPIADRVASAPTLVISADAVLQRVPFGMLPNPRTGRPILETAAVVLTSDGSLRRTRPRSVPTTGGPVLVAGDPAAADTRTPPLPFADREARRVAQLYPGAVLMLGGKVTRRTLLEQLPKARVFHFAGHALTSASAPGLSRLVVSPGDDDSEGAVFARDIAGMPLTAAVAVLAACDTAGGVVRAGVGTPGLAQAFLEAGTEWVVATIWPMADRPAAEFFEDLHRHLATGVPPPQSVANAQRAARARGVPAAIWAGVVVYGSTS